MTMEQKQPKTAKSEGTQAELTALSSEVSQLMTMQDCHRYEFCTLYRPPTCEQPLNLALQLGFLSYSALQVLSVPAQKFSETRQSHNEKTRTGCC